MVLFSIAKAIALRPEVMMMMLVKPFSIPSVATLALVMPALMRPMMAFIMMVMPILRTFVAVRSPLCS